MKHCSYLWKNYMLSETMGLRIAQAWLFVMCMLFVICRESAVGSLHFCFTLEALRPFWHLPPFLIESEERSRKVLHKDEPLMLHLKDEKPGQVKGGGTAGANALWSQRAPGAEG